MTFSRQNSSPVTFWNFTKRLVIERHFNYQAKITNHTFFLWWNHETRCHNKEGFHKLKSFIGYATRDKEVYWRISQNPPLSGPFRLTTPLFCSSFILIAIVWRDLPVWLAICVVVTNLSVAPETLGSIISCLFLYDFCEVSVKSLSGQPVHYCLLHH